MKNRRLPIMALLVTALLMFGILVAMPADNISAAPAAAPTPISVTYSATPGKVLEFLRVPVSYTADFNTSPLTVMDFEAVDLQYVIDQTAVASVVNTTTLKLQFSNDGTNWVDGATIVSANTADANTLSQLAVFGRLARVNVDVSNTNPITISVIAVGK